MKWLAAGLFCAIGASAQAIPISGQGTWETTLQARDLDGDGSTDAFYDTFLNISWLADANYAASQGIKSWRGPGTMENPRPYIENLTLFGLTDWRLPTAGNGDHSSCSNRGMGIAPGRHCSFQASPADSELAFMYYVHLGNQYGVGGLQNTGDFLNVMAGEYATGSRYTGQYAISYPSTLNTFAMGSGTKILGIEGFPFYAWAVHDGDVGAIAAPIPEPETYAMMLAGLAGLAAYVRRRKTK